MDYKEQMEYGQARGWNPLGNKEVRIKHDLSDCDRLKFGKEIADSLNQIRKLERERKETLERLGAQVKKLESDAFHKSYTLELGFEIETMVVPCFFDPETHQRVYVDSETGHEVERGNSEPEDKQYRLC